MTRDELEVYISEKYIEYQKFMNIDGMPALHIVIGDVAQDAIMCIYLGELYDKNIILHTNYGITKECNDFTHYNATLFHEFTHIYDGLKILSLFPDIKYDEFASILYQYSEPHAFYVEICVEAKYENIDTPKAIDKTDIITIGIKTKTLKNHFFDSLNTVIDISNENEMNYKRYNIEISYFWGMAMFCEKQLGYKVDFKQFPEKYSKKFNEWYNAVFENNICGFVNKNFNQYVGRKKQARCPKCGSDKYGLEIINRKILKEKRLLVCKDCGNKWKV